MRPSIFIEAKRLGSVTEMKVRHILTIPNKRKRMNEAKKLVSLLRFLTIAPIAEDELLSPTGVALGIRSDGELGLWLIYEPAIKIQGDIAI